VTAEAGNQGVEVEVREAHGPTQTFRSRAGSGQADRVHLALAGADARRPWLKHYWLAALALVALNLPSHTSPSSPPHLQGRQYYIWLSPRRLRYHHHHHHHHHHHGHDHDHGHDHSNHVGGEAAGSARFGMASDDSPFETYEEDELYDLTDTQESMGPSSDLRQRAAIMNAIDGLDQNGDLARAWEAMGTTDIVTFLQQRLGEAGVALMNMVNLGSNNSVSSRMEQSDWSSMPAPQDVPDISIGAIAREMQVEGLSLAQRFDLVVRNAEQEAAEAREQVRKLRREQKEQAQQQRNSAHPTANWPVNGPDPMHELMRALGHHHHHHHHHHDEVHGDEDFDDLAPDDDQMDPHMAADEERMRIAWGDLITQQVEVLFVLAVLAGGRRKEQIHQILVRNGIVEILERLFPKLGWGRDDEHDNPHLGIHGANCECNPAGALKIQYLRLIHNFSDREGTSRSNKRLLLSKMDLRVCALLADKSEHESYRLAEKAFQRPLNFRPGLLYRLVRLLETEDPNSQYRFWIASTVEAFLRGATREEQLLVSSWGLMDHLLTQLFSDGVKNPGVLQTNFDLLGELIKFNRTQLEVLTAKLGPGDLQRLLDLALCHLVDSNVFLRSLFMTLEKFRLEEPTFFVDNPIDAVLRKHRIPILRSLMTVVHLDSVSQENICCLNTALVLLLFAHRQGVLPQYLQAVEELDPSVVEDLIETARQNTRAKADASSAGGVDEAASEAAMPSLGGALGADSNDDESSSHAAFPAQGAPPLQNCRALLWFWRRYYISNNSQDRNSLAASSGIPFEEFAAIADLLCADDGSETSLLRQGQPLDVPTLIDLM